MAKTNNHKTVFVGLSGGVDSSVAAYLLKKQNHNVVGVHIRSWNKDGCDEIEAEYARRVAEHLGIPFYIFDLEKEYKASVVDYMIHGYKIGLTPNPDVMCNKEIKFGVFLKKALELGADYVATGHYVRLKESRISNKEYRNNPILNSKFYSLYSALDPSKDQSYFLWTLTQDQLKHCLFPIGDYKKTEIRKIAKRINLPTADKKDSQGICFVGQVSIKDFLKEYLPPKKGKVIDEFGKVVGYHDGVQFYTIGQRHGLGIGGRARHSFSEGGIKPYYISGKSAKTNTIHIAYGEENPELYRKEIKLAQVNLINHIKIPKKGLKLKVRVRYRQPLAAAQLLKIVPHSAGSRETGKIVKLKIIFAKEQRFIAPGQSAVIYDKNGAMLGGGVIL